MLKKKKAEPILTVRGAFGMSASGTKEELKPWLKEQRKLEQTMTEDEWKDQMADELHEVLSSRGLLPTQARGSSSMGKKN